MSLFLSIKAAADRLLICHPFGMVRLRSYVCPSLQWSVIQSSFVKRLVSTISYPSRILASPNPPSSQVLLLLLFPLLLFFPLLLQFLPHFPALISCSGLENLDPSSRTPVSPPRWRSPIFHLLSNTLYAETAIQLQAKLNSG